MIEEVKDLMEDVKEKVGDKGFAVIVICLIAVGAYLVYRSFTTSSPSGTVYYEPTGVTNYPTVGENADVVIDSVNKSIEGSYNELSSEMTSRFEYIEGILDEVQTEMNMNTNDIINTSNQNTEYIVQTSNQNTQSIIQNSNQNTQAIVQNSNKDKEEIVSVVEKVMETKSIVNNDANETQSYTPPVTQSAPVVSKPAPAPEPETYTYTTKAGLNTNTSIVDALKATGADSSFDARAKLYYANGGTGTYTGSYSQNVQMLNKMKSGNLKKA